MANSYTSIFIHVIFSTHNRERVLISSIQKDLWVYMGGIARENKIKGISIGGTLDHVHNLISIPATMPVAKAVQLIKSGSSKWLHETYMPLRNFSWQEGYGAFSVGASQLDGVISYIENQKEHHRIKTFQEEYIGFLKQYNIQYDEKYIWG